MRFDSEDCFGPTAARHAEFSAQDRVPQKTDHLGSESVGVPWRNEHPRHLILDNLGYPSTARRHDRPSDRHRLGQY